MFFSNQLMRNSNIRHCFFSKNNGVSKGIYKSLNCGYGSNDNKINIKKNLEIVAKKINCNSKNIVTMKQVHGNKVFYLSSKKKIKNKLVCDSILTNKKGIAIAVLTADCVPILIFDKRKKIIAAIHAGWKGAFKDIINKTVKKFLKLGSKKKNLLVSIGPCISQKNYEVRTEFFKKFLIKDKVNKKFFKKKNDKYLFNLRKFVNYQFTKNNINNIDHIKKDTFSDTKNFYSYRRSLFKKEVDYGRNISIIMIN